ncbi:MAG: hypothetical protein NTY15_16255, partial [Planctomycetota bacterium]|nr:hypothetical protein [Planctomycetota bacterium]
MNRKTFFHWYVLIPGMTGFLIAMAIAWSRWPSPTMHDDFGNLLVASTLLEGRLSNPVPEAWESMETFHVVFQPSYASKYPIGLGFMLAVGKLIFGTFAAGLWLCAGLASASIAWMIAAHFPRRWAMASGMATATHPIWQNGWSQEFTNGWLAVTGTAIVLGGLLRIRRRFRSPSTTRKLVNSAAPRRPSTTRKLVNSAALRRPSTTRKLVNSAAPRRPSTTRKLVNSAANSLACASCYVSSEPSESERQLVNSAANSLACASCYVSSEPSESERQLVNSAANSLACASCYVSSEPSES